MAEVFDTDYARMKRFVFLFVTEVLKVPADSEMHPAVAMEAIESRSQSQARKGLRMAVSDMVEMSERMSNDDVVRLDAHLAANDAMTLTEARGQFSKSLKAVLKRQHILTETEYYLVRNAVDSAEPDKAPALWVLLADFEQRIGGTDT